MFGWIRDRNRDGNIDGRDYWDDLGGAYYFRPRGIYNRNESCGEVCFAAIFKLILAAFMLYVAMN